MQQLQQGCPFTAAAYAIEPLVTDGRARAMDFRKLGAAIDPTFGATVADAFAAADKADSRADSLEWLRDFCMSCALHGEEIQNFLERIGRKSIEAETVRSTLPRERRRSQPYPVHPPADLRFCDVVPFDKARTAK